MRFFQFICVAIVGILCLSCNKYQSHVYRKMYSQVTEIENIDSSQYKYLKAHFKDGRVAMLNSWEINEAEDSIIGQGGMFDIKRDLKAYGRIGVAISDVSLFETNHKDFIDSDNGDLITGLAILTTMNTVFATFCITVPKACFGSCPTFYFEPDKDVYYADAEGFSNAIVPSMQNTDIDDLNKSSSNDIVKLYLKNEALETHMIDDIHLETIPIQEGERAYMSIDGEYVISGRQESPIKVLGGNPMNLDLFRNTDANEYFSTTDSFQLETKEVLEFQFAPFRQADSKAILINFRQTFLTTYLFYECLSLAGDEATDFLSQVNLSDKSQKHYDRIFKKLGRIEVLVQSESNSGWEKIAEIGETGPIARNTQVVRLPEQFNSEEQIQVRLRMTKGHWRIDQLGLINVKKVAQPTNVWPQLKILRGENIESKLKGVDNTYLSTFPGDEYELIFELPEGQNHQLFLSSTGYYLEWLRKEWLEEKDIPKLKKLIRGDKRTWEEVARDFKEVEAQMESDFWSSKYNGVQ